jgi:hypothetical protein
MIFFNQIDLKGERPEMQRLSNEHNAVVFGMLSLS